MTADEAIEYLREVAKGPYVDTKRSTNVREFTPMPNLPKYEFKLDPEFPQYKKKK